MGWRGIMLLLLIMIMLCGRDALKHFLGWARSVKEFMMMSRDMLIAENDSDSIRMPLSHGITNFSSEWEQPRNIFRRKLAMQKTVECCNKLTRKHTHTTNKTLQVVSVCVAWSGISFAIQAERKLISEDDDDHGMMMAKGRNQAFCEYQEDVSRARVYHWLPQNGKLQVNKICCGILLYVEWWSWGDEDEILRCCCYCKKQQQPCMGFPKSSSPLARATTHNFITTTCVCLYAWIVWNMAKNNNMQHVGRWRW